VPWLLLCAPAGPISAPSSRLAANGRAMYTFNVSDFCKLHREYLERGTGHAGIIVVPRQGYTVKQQIRLLLNLLKTESAEDMRNRLWFL
jgi:hypothetical protein